MFTYFYLKKRDGEGRIEGEREIEETNIFHSLVHIPETCSSEIVRNRPARYQNAIT